MLRASTSYSDELEILDDPGSSGIALRGLYKTEEVKPVTVLTILPAAITPWSKVSPNHTFG